MEQFTKALATELADKKVTVNSVSPGSTDTELLPQERREFGKSASVFGRLGTPEDIAEVVGFLTQEKSRWITGQNLIASGGATMIQ